MALDAHMCVCVCESTPDERQVCHDIILFSNNNVTIATDRVINNNINDDFFWNKIL